MENNVAKTINKEPIIEPKYGVEAKSEPEQIKEKRSNKDEKSKKKEDKSIEQMIKSLQNLQTPEEKLTALCKKYLEVVDENRKMQVAIKQAEKQVMMIQREKDQIQSEKSKAVLARSRLESLCREFQRQNKAIKEESLLKIREEEEKRKEVSAKFQSTLTEITALMAETNEKNVKLHEDNIEIHKKFKSVFDEMDIREQHFENMHQMMKQELKVAEAKLAKVTLEMTEEKETLLRDKNTLLIKLAEYQARIKELQTVESNLRSQVEMYTDKYDEFQNALTKSNEVFGGFNQEMEKMSKKNLKLEKENNVWKSRWEKSNAALLEMATDKQTRDGEIATLNKKCSLLQELCKAFQQERATLLTQLKEKTNDVDIKKDEEVKDNQQLSTNIKNAEDPKSVTALLEEIDAKSKEQTQNSKTEKTICPLVKKSDSKDIPKKVGSSKKELQSKHNKNKNDIENEDTVNNSDKKRLTENESVKISDTNSTINNSDSITEQKISLECNVKIEIQQVPVKTINSTQNENVIPNLEQSTNSLEDINRETSLVELSIMDQTQDSNKSDTLIQNSSDIQNNLQCRNEPEKIDCEESNTQKNFNYTIQPKVSNKSENQMQESEATIIKNTPVDNTVEKLNAVTSNGDVQTVPNKKPKEGKTKKK